MAIHISEVQDGLPTIGEKYVVPCVLYKQHGGEKYVPVIGNVHEDKYYFDVDWYHIHLDVRFFTDDMIRWVMQGTSTNPKKALGFALQREYIKCHLEREMECQREMPVFPFRGCDDMVTALQDKLPPKKRSMSKCMKCPHHGTPLNGIPVNNNVIVCPAHGLAFDAKTREMVLRSKRKTYDGK